MEDFELKSGGAELLDLVKPLWEQLNKQHEKQSNYFKNRYKSFNFEARKEKFLNDTVLGVNIALIKKAEMYVGYCISSINKGLEGEIDSIFVAYEYRKLDLGDKLMRNALEWLDKNKVKTRRIGVIDGNEEVLRFYKKYGFYKRIMILEEINKNS
jgi:ribosomal protein S18 acetylase RimI-like enzyme